MEHVDYAILGYGALEPPPRKRFGEKLKFLPVFYVVLAQFMLTSIYLSQHIWPLLQAVGEEQVRGWWQFGTFILLTVMMLICYVRSILTHPGEIPDGPEWESSGIPWRQQPQGTTNQQETKRSGDRRHCKWCAKFKPDRCHHCRTCGMCILKMDHHCPWIYNCVGFYNYKFFILLLFYSALDCHLILWSMTESMLRCVYHTRTPFAEMFLVFFGEFMASIFAILARRPTILRSDANEVSLFLAMHLWMISRGLSTIEFCEKILPKDGRSEGYASMYDLGLLANFQAALGPVWSWLLPLGRPEGDGLSFPCDEALKDLAKRKAQGQRSRLSWPSYGAADLEADEDTTQS